VLPESVVWLYANGRIDEAEQIIRNAAKLNNITMPDKILVRPEIDVTADSDKHGEKSNDDRSAKSVTLLNSLRRLEKTKEGSARLTIRDIFRNRRLTTHLLCTSFMWSVKSFSYGID